MKISGVYKITNTVTGDFYIGSSKDVKDRWIKHKCPSVWKQNPNKLLYQDMQKYGIEKFDFQILANVEVDQLKEAEQKFIEMLKPTYNSNRANGLDAKKVKECQKRYRQSEKSKEYQKKYHQSEKNKKYRNRYYSQLCSYNGKTLTLRALSDRFLRAGIEHPVLEAKKYLLVK